MAGGTGVEEEVEEWEEVWFGEKSSASCQFGGKMPVCWRLMDIPCCPMASGTDFSSQVTWCQTLTAATAVGVTTVSHQCAVVSFWCIRFKMSSDY